MLEAWDGPEALPILATTQPDLLVTDVALPSGMNGRVAEAGMLNGALWHGSPTNGRRGAGG